MLDSLDLCSLTRTTLSLFSLSLSPRLPKNGKIRNGFRDRLQERSSTKAKRKRKGERKKVTLPSFLVTFSGPPLSNSSPPLKTLLALSFSLLRYCFSYPTFERRREERGGGEEEGREKQGRPPPQFSPPSIVPLLLRTLLSKKQNKTKTHFLSSSKLFVLNSAQTASRRSRPGCAP